MRKRKLVAFYFLIVYIIVMTCLYTKAELITKIKSLDTKIDTGILSADLDTNQARQKFTKSIAQMKMQRNWYYRMLQQYYPGNYGDVINLSSDRR